MLTMGLVAALALAAHLPDLPARNGAVVLPAQKSPNVPGARSITTYIRYPSGARDSVTAETGLMLCLHNWGGTDAVGAPDPVQVAKRYNVVAISVDYFQSGNWDVTLAPYDFGYLQALDALRALYFVFHGLERTHIPFARGRIYACGGSGGGNVSLMVNKLAPRTFACVVDISGMAKLSDEIAYSIPGKTTLNAGYSRDATSAAYLSADGQQLRFIGHPEHLHAMKALGNTAKVLVIHGEDDPTCPVDDVRELVAHFQAAGLDVEPHFIAKSDVDGATITGTVHSLGDRTKILFKFADMYLMPGSRQLCTRSVKTDFERREGDVRFVTPSGCFEISYRAGYPVGRFVAARKTLTK